MMSSDCLRPGTTPSLDLGEGVVCCGFAECITPQVRAVANLISSFWPHRFELRLEASLREAFPRPENPGLLHIWRYGRADILVCNPSGEGPVAVIELHGEHHWTEKQARNDRRKYVLATENGVGHLAMYNSVVDRISRRQMRGLLGGVLFRRSGPSVG